MEALNQSDNQNFRRRKKNDKTGFSFEYFGRLLDVLRMQVDNIAGKYAGSHAEAITFGPE